MHSSLDFLRKRISITSLIYHSFLFTWFWLALKTGEEYEFFNSPMFFHNFFHLENINLSDIWNLFWNLPKDCYLTQFNIIIFSVWVLVYISYLITEISVGATADHIYIDALIIKVIFDAIYIFSKLFLKWCIWIRLNLLKDFISALTLKGQLLLKIK